MERIKAEAGSQNWREHRERLLGTTKKLDLSAKFKLPILPGAVQEFSRTSEIPDISNDVLARILESDSGLTVELLSLVNSSVFGLRSKASSVKQALNLLGLHRAKTFILTTAVKRAMSKSSSKLINLNLFWANNLERALFAREVALLLKADPEIAYSAAMLQDFLLPVLTTALFEQYTDYVDQQQRTPQLLCSYEQKRFGWDHATAAAQVALQWGLPDELICCLYLHHQGLALLLEADYATTSAAAVALSSLLPDVLSQSVQGLDQLIELQSRWPRFDLVSLAERTELQYREMGGDQVHYLTLKRRLEKKLASLGTTGSH